MIVNKFLVCLFLVLFLHRYIYCCLNCCLLEESPKCITYHKIALFEDANVIPSYLKLKLNNAATIGLAHFRCRNHRLMIERGTWIRPILERSLRVCHVCNILEDEFHFILVCLLYSTLRSHYIRNIFWENPTMVKLVDLFNGSQKDLYGLYHFLRKAEELYSQLFLENL